MRFIAAMLVFGIHVTVLNPFASSDAQRGFEWFFLHGGWIGVGFFFVLSGFVLTWSARPTDTTRAFWRRRFFKIYPNHLVTFVAALLLLVFATGATVDPQHALYNLLLIQSWFPELEIRGSFNGPSWSLSCEALFYLSFPWLLRLIDRIRPERLWAWAIGVAAAVVAIAAVAQARPDGPLLPVVFLDDTEFWLVYQFPATRMLDFVFGILLARIVMTGRRVPVGLGGATALAVGGYVLTTLTPPAFGVVAVMIVPLGLVIAAAARADVAGRPSWLSSRVMVWLGEVSFAFYMWHSLVVNYGHQWLGYPRSSTPVALAEIALLFAVTLLLAWLQFSRIEQPVMRRFARHRPAPAGAVPAPRDRGPAA
ncbi:acyltransferase [Micromonospora cathayae]